MAAHKEELQDLLMFYSSKEKKLVTLDEYVARMPEDQKYIYYASGETMKESRSCRKLRWYRKRLRNSVLHG